jgi:hypothetical protein
MDAIDYIGRESHNIWKPHKELITCEICNEKLQPKNYDTHSKSQHHIKYVNLIKGLEDNVKTITRVPKHRYALFDKSKNDMNCCIKCLSCDIHEDLFNKKYKLCRCCEEILKGGTKTCRDCKNTFQLIELERPYLQRCKLCAKHRKIRTAIKAEEF